MFVNLTHLACVARGVRFRSFGRLGVAATSWADGWWCGLNGRRGLNGWCRRRVNLVGIDEREVHQLLQLVGSML